MTLPRSKLALLRESAEASRAAGHARVEMPVEEFLEVVGMAERSVSEETMKALSDYQRRELPAMVTLDRLVTLCLRDLREAAEEMRAGRKP